MGPCSDWLLFFFGGDLLIKRWTFFVFLGVLAAVCGIVFLYDLIDGVADIAAEILGAALLIQGMFELVAGTAHTRIPACGAGCRCSEALPC